MYAISNLFKQYLSQASREFEIKAIINGITYDHTSVVYFELEDDALPSDDFEIGTVVSAKFTLAIKTANIIPTNAEIQPSVRMAGAEGYTEWIPLSVYYVDSRSYANYVWTFTCYDRLILAEQEYVSALDFPISMRDVWDELCGLLGVESDVEINPAYMIPYKPEGLYTIREMMGFIASAHCASVRMTKEGKVGFIKFIIEAETTSILPSDCFKLLQTDEPKNYTKIILTYNDDGETLEAGDDEGNTLNIFNPFMDETILDNVVESFAGESGLWLNWPFDFTVLDDVFSVAPGFTYSPITMDWRGRPDLEPGDRVLISQRDGSKIETILMNNKLSFRGGLKETSLSPVRSEQQSEFDYTGTLTRAVQNIAKNSVQLDQPYYGVTIGRINGIKVEKSNGISQAIFNSDTIRITKNEVAVFDVDADGEIDITAKVHLSPGSTIDWGVITPPSAVQVGALPDDWSGATYIDQYGVYTGRIQASQIDVGVLNGFTLNSTFVNASDMLRIDGVGSTLPVIFMRDTGRGAIDGTTITASTSNPGNPASEFGTLQILIPSKAGFPAQMVLSGLSGSGANLIVSDGAVKANEYYGVDGVMKIVMAGNHCYFVDSLGAYKQMD